MKSPLILSIVLATSASLLAGAAHGGVTVNFVEPEKFTDMPFNSYDKQRVMEDLKKHFDRLASGLTAGQELKIDVLDIDLAGRIEPNRTTQDLRILRGRADWPAITLRYNLESQGKSLKSGEERIFDMAYLSGHNHYNSGENLRYEKQMLDTWFKKTLTAPKGGS